MPLGRGLTGSEVKYISALSPIGIGAAGSSNAIDLSGFEFGTMLVAIGSANDGQANTFHLLRSATSDGTFNGFGASVGTVPNGSLVARSFTVGSQVWHKLYYNNVSGSMNAAVILEMQGARHTPVDQDSKTTVYSTIL